MEIRAAPPVLAMNAPAPGDVDDFSGVLLELEEGPEAAEDEEDDKKDGEPEDDGDEDEELDLVIQPPTDEERDAMRGLIETFTQDELHRFEASRRSKLSKGVIKKVLQNILGMQNPSPKICIAVAGSAKIFVGEIVALALEVMSDWGETGALTPDHLREAYLRYQQKSNQSIR